MSFSMAGKGPSHPQMNVTPLIDVLLVLIIIFMVVVIEQKPTGLDAQIPQPAITTPPNIPQPQGTIVIQILQAQLGAAHPSVKVNEEVVEWDRLPDRLRDIFAIRVERTAFLKADNDIDFQTVADVIAIAKTAGVDRVGLLTEDGKHVPVAG
ncbi:MAG: ExbD/TolR family protein [Terriglobales bacterium]